MIKVRLRRIEIKEEKRELVLRLEDEVLDWEYEDGGSLPLLFNYTNIYMSPLTNIFFTNFCLIVPNREHPITSILQSNYLESWVLSELVSRPAGVFCSFLF